MANGVPRFPNFPTETRGKRGFQLPNLCHAKGLRRPMARKVPPLQKHEKGSASPAPRNATRQYKRSVSSIAMNNSRQEEVAADSTDDTDQTGAFRYPCHPRLSAAKLLSLVPAMPSGDGAASSAARQRRIQTPAHRPQKRLILVLKPLAEGGRFLIARHYEQMVCENTLRRQRILPPILRSPG